MSSVIREKTSLELAPRDGGPAWLEERRRAASSALARDGFPTKKTEAWRFTPTRPFVEEATQELRAQTEEARARAEALPRLSEARVVLVDGAPVSLPEIRGVRFARLVDALAERARPLASLDAEDAFARLNATRFDDGLSIEVSADVDPQTVLELVHVATSAPGSVRYPRVVIALAPNASLTIVERAIGADEPSVASHTVVDVELAEGARLEHVRIGEDRGLSTAWIAVRAARHAFYGSRVATLRGRIARTHLEVSLEGEGAEAELLGVYRAREKDHLDHHLVVHHRVPHCTSQMRHHGVIDDKATAVFDGITVVHRDAQGTVAHQENRNLLLSESATVHTKPHLEIDADDVKCSHGTTVGSLDEQSLFYMRARGIPEETARAMLTEAFLRAPVDTIRDERVREALLELVGAEEGR